ncbi:WXG100 family type VII secretion target [Streptomyces halobius]|uniref:WXG100 family type VII secretion target n=1 Tax=Streptomyces halobius TaxID=2879846 RepID=A0ABY4M4Z1_9ACTN|nr:WXG100 family type VII secretion target [Streptomyces halobius]UQA92753.1 WXG100 family type VII secretion target [Streptomyces halobius]
MTERRNPEALHEAAAGWRDMGRHLDGLVRDLDRQVGRAAAANWQGPAGEAFAADWHRLKRSVDESLPAFELAAADLETAAASAQHTDDNSNGNGNGADRPAPSPDNSASQSSGGRDAMYGFMAMGQLAAGLGGAFGKRGGGGGQGNRPPVVQKWATSGAAHGPDPFGPPGEGDATPRGGEGIAKGRRTSPPVPEATAAPDPKGKQDGKSSASPAPSAGGQASTGPTARTGNNATGDDAEPDTNPDTNPDAKPGSDAAKPSANQRGAFG